jgi:hypothetical protein
MEPWMTDQGSWQDMGAMVDDWMGEPAGGMGELDDNLRSGCHWSRTSMSARACAWYRPTMAGFVGLPRHTKGEIQDSLAHRGQPLDLANG